MQCPPWQQIICADHLWNCVRKRCVHLVFHLSLALVLLVPLLFLLLLLLLRVLLLLVVVVRAAADEARLFKTNPQSLCRLSGSRITDFMGYRTDR